MTLDGGVLTEVEIGDLDKTALYRLYDVKGKLLYVGVTDNLKNRFAQHAKVKSWWPSVAKRTVTWYDTRPDAEAAEDAAMLNESPVHNVMLPPGMTKSQYQPHSGCLRLSGSGLRSRRPVKGRPMTDVVLDALADYQMKVSS